MDKNAIRNYAVWARRELIARVSQKALQFGITETNMVAADADSINGRLLSHAEKQQRQALMAQIQAKGFMEVMEEVAYTWFNRFSALRFMEVNGYLPSRVRVFTDEENVFKPQIIDEAIRLELDGLDREKVFAYKEANQTEELYKYLLITQCNALNGILPGMFQKIADYTELLLPDNLLREGSVIHQMIELIPEDDWQDAVQIIGWLYQFYNTEPKARIDKKVKSQGKVEKEEIPAKTQLFTPDWIVRYMVENSLGRLWVEGHPDTASCFMPTVEEQKRYADGERATKDTKWHYYLEEAQQEPEVKAQLAEIRRSYADMDPKDIKVIDPCCGSGHILAYLFDVLMQIYESYGYTSRDAVSSILRNNLYGLDIDDRAAQLSYFSVMMKARHYDHRFFSHTEQPHVYAICESNHLDSNVVDYFCKGDTELINAITTIQEELYDAKEYGSILTVTPQDWNALYKRFDEIADDNSMFQDFARNELLPMVQVAEALAQQYDTVVANPPYMALTSSGAILNRYVVEHFPMTKADLFSVFIERCGQLTKNSKFFAMITQQSWLSLPSFLEMRKAIFEKHLLVDMAQLGAHSFNEISGEVVSSVSFSFRNTYLHGYAGHYSDLQTGKSEEAKETQFLSKKFLFSAKQDSFQLVPNSVVVYEATENSLEKFTSSPALKEYVIAKPGMQTSDNERFLRLWHEISYACIGFGYTHENAANSEFKWFPYNKGIGFRKWYGNNDYVVNFYHDGEELKYWLVHNPKDPGTKHWSRNMRNYDYYFSDGITFTAIGNAFSARLNGEGYLFDTKGPMMFGREICAVGGFVNTIVFDFYNRMLCKQITKSADSVNLVPFELPRGKKHAKVVGVVNAAIGLSRNDWDSFETSWDFQVHPLASKALSCGHVKDNGAIDLENTYHFVKQDYEQRFQQLKANEEELNRIFIDIYGLQDELTPEVEDKDVTVYRYFDEKEDIPASMGSSRYALTKRDMIVSFISYAVGCMLGRYSLDVEGLAFAGGEWDDSKYRTFPADRDNIIPICDDEYFNDDIVGRFVAFVKTVYGADTLEDNLRFIGDALGGKGQPRDIIRRYFLYDFFKDHCQTYQKRPIYWLFDSGKKDGFKALIYMHRYQPDTIARLRTDYVHEQQSRYRTAIADVEQRMTGATTSERVKLSKTLTKLQEQDTELRGYEEKIHHLADQMISIDLDDGVKHNYELFQDVLAKIK